MRWRRYLRILGPDVRADVRDEMRFHLDARIAQLMESGSTCEQAEHDALRQFGNVREVSAMCREIGE